ncbi:MAG: T9SS type A sorting domain-containing protein, partial [Bacteroidia bacterium]
AGGTAFDGGTAISSDAAGNAYATGYFRGTADFSGTMLTAGNQDVYIAKYNSGGTLQWVADGKGTNAAIGLGIDVDAGGNVYVSGTFKDTLSFGTTEMISEGVEDIFLAKFNSSGSLIWAHQLGGTGYGYVTALAVTAAGETHLTGQFTGALKLDAAISFNSSQTSFTDVFIAKFDASGNLTWALQEGGNSDEYSEDIAVDASGNIYIAGYFYGTADFSGQLLVSQALEDLYVAKYNASGILQWIKTAGSSLSDQAFGIAVDMSGTVFVTGGSSGNVSFGPYTLTNQGNSDIIIAAYDQNGFEKWALSYGQNGDDRGRQIQVDNAGALRVTGTFGNTITFGAVTMPSSGPNDIFVVKLNAPTAIQEIITSDVFYAYPNPSHNLLNIPLDAGSKDVVLRLMNSFGQVLYETKEKNTGRSTIDLSHYSSGIYYLQVQKGNTISTTKVMVD